MDIRHVFLCVAVSYALGYYTCYTREYFKYKPVPAKQLDDKINKLIALKMGLISD